jgi:hypothetical protein
MPTLSIDNQACQSPSTTQEWMTGWHGRDNTNGAQRLNFWGFAGLAGGFGGLGFFDFSFPFVF